MAVIPIIKLLNWLLLSKCQILGENLSNSSVILGFSLTMKWLSESYLEVVACPLSLSEFFRCFFFLPTCWQDIVRYLLCVNSFFIRVLKRQRKMNCLNNLVSVITTCYQWCFAKGPLSFGIRLVFFLFFRHCTSNIFIATMHF